MTDGTDVKSALNGCGEDGTGGTRCGDPTAAEAAAGGRGHGAECAASLGTFRDCFRRAVDAGTAGCCGTGAAADDDADRTRSGGTRTGAEERQRRGSAEGSAVGDDQGQEGDAGSARAADGCADAGDRETAGEGAKDSAGCSRNSRRSDSVLVNAGEMRALGANCLVKSRGWMGAVPVRHRWEFIDEGAPFKMVLIGRGGSTVGVLRFGFSLTV